MRYRFRGYFGSSSEPDFFWMRPPVWLHWFRPESLVEDAVTAFAYPAKFPFHSSGENPWLDRILEPQSGRHKRTKIDPNRLGDWMPFGVHVNVLGDEYKPKRDPKLARAFAALLDGGDLQAVKADVLKFARTHGALGYGAWVKTPIDDFTYAEPIGYWICESFALRRCFELLDALRAGHPRAARKTLTTEHLEGQGMAIRMAPPAMDTLPGWLQSVAGISPEKLVLLSSPYPLDVTYRLGYRVSPVTGEFGPLDQAEVELILLLDRKVAENVEVRCFDLQSKARLPVARNLLGHLYLCFLELLKDTKRINCSNCGNELKDRKRKHPNNFCDSKCRGEFRRDAARKSRPVE